MTVTFLQRPNLPLLVPNNRVSSYDRPPFPNGPEASYWCSFPLSCWDVNDSLRSGLRQDAKQDPERLIDHPTFGQ